jgi:exodeoxyribonuclease V beta subunit
VLRSHLTAGDPLHGYAERLADRGLRSTVRGYLTGSLDLVVRVPGPGGEPRFAVIDYKTNRLAAPDEPLTAAHYGPALLEDAMRHSHYGLQALLYAIALHRYLRWRLPGYDPDRNLAGVLYLFLRGMRGAEAPASGVWSWRPSGLLVQELSDVLDRGDA